MKDARDNSGNAIVLAITVSIFLLIMVLTAIILIRQQTNLTSGSRRKSEALSVAEAGLDAAIWRLERNQTLPFDPITNKYNFSGSNTQGGYDVEVEKINDTKFQVTSTGTKTATNSQKAVRQDIYYINLSRSIVTLSGANGGGTINGSVNIWGPFYTSGDLHLSGSTGSDNLVGTTGNPFMVKGDLYLDSAGVDIGSVGSPMAVFVKGSIIPASRAGQVHNLVSNSVPDVSLPSISSTQLLDTAQANNNAVYTGNLTLNTNVVNFGDRGDGTYVFNYNGTTNPATLKVDGTVYIDGDLTFSKKTRYEHSSYPSSATVFADGKIVVDEEIKALQTYPSQSNIAFVNEDKAPMVSEPGSKDTYDIKIDVAGGVNSLVQAFFYSSGQISVFKSLTVEGTIIANRLWLENPPDLKAPSSPGSNYPVLYPGKDLAFIITSNWREVSP